MGKLASEVHISEHSETKQHSPILIGLLAFSIAFAFTLIAWLVDFKQAKDYAYYFSYIQNISWSVSLLFIFPPVIGFTYYYSLKMPKLVPALIASLSHNKDQNQFENHQKIYQTLQLEMDKHSNSFFIKFTIVFLSLGANLAYFATVYYSPFEGNSWMLIRDIGRFTFLGILGILFQIGLTWWILRFVINNLFFISMLYSFFSHRDCKLELDPLHPDGISGLEKLKDMATLQSVIILLMGLYVSLKVIDKLYQQNMSLAVDIGNPVVIIAYIILAPLLFFLILGAPHERMRRAKEKFLHPITQRITLLTKTLTTADVSHAEAQSISEEIKFLQDEYKTYSKQISVWPFNWLSIQGFFGSVITPILPPISAGIGYIGSFFK